MKDYIGMRVGKLVIIEKMEGHTFSAGRRRFKLLAKCDCGNDHVVDIRNLYKTNSCGCGKQKLPLKLATMRRIMHYYKANAKKKDNLFELSDSEFEHLIKSPCYYCGDTETNHLKERNYKITYEMKYNGIDRVDNSKGYVKENVVSCCKICNGMKSNMSRKEFETHIAKIVQNNLSIFI